MPLQVFKLSLWMGEVPESVEAKKFASRPLLAAGPPMNTSRGDTSRGNYSLTQSGVRRLRNIDENGHPTPCQAARS